MKSVISEESRLTLQKQTVIRGSPAIVIRQVAGAICAGILVIILLAGLWPFRAPANQVAWISGENGIEFGPRGVAASTGEFIAPSHDVFTLELVLLPARAAGSGTILAIDDSSEPKNDFALRQIETGLAIQRPVRSGRGRLWWSTGNVFTRGRTVVLSIIHSESADLLYVDGKFASRREDFGLNGGDLQGRLILGSSARGDNWSGRIIGLALYEEALTPSEVAQHCAGWYQHLTPGAEGRPSPAALYLFDERTGDLVHDRIGGRPSLVIRSRYFLVRPGFLVPVWDAYQSRWDGWRTRSYWSDVCVNIAGFVPFGFFFAAWLSMNSVTQRPRLLAFILGLTVSLAIESAQHFLPTRDSSMTDWVTNTIGTAIGVGLWRPGLVQRLVRGFGKCMMAETEPTLVGRFVQKSRGAYLTIARQLWKRLPLWAGQRKVTLAWARHLDRLVRVQADRRQYFATFFLRNRPEMELLRNIAEHWPFGARLNMCVLACSKGAEVYSMAWIIRSARRDLELSIHAIDISSEILDFAARGVYSLRASDALDQAREYAGQRNQVRRNTARDQNASIFERLSAAELEAMFVINGHEASIRPELQRGINWICGDAGDLHLQAAVGLQDIVIANRFLCHMQPEQARQCLRRIGRLVRPGGYLFVSGIDLDVRTRVALEAGWTPVTEMMREMHDGDESIRRGWPLEYWGLEPFDERRPDWQIRYASVFRVGDASSSREELAVVGSSTR